MSVYRSRTDSDGSSSRCQRSRPPSSCARLGTPARLASAQPAAAHAAAAHEHHRTCVRPAAGRRLFDGLSGMIDRARQMRPAANSAGSRTSIRLTAASGRATLAASCCAEMAHGCSSSGCRNRRIDGAVDRRMLAAHRAIGAACETQFLEAHLQRVVGQQSADQRRADAGDELDGLGRLERCPAHRAARPARRPRRSWVRRPASMLGNRQR